MNHNLINRSIYDLPPNHIPLTIDQVIIFTTVIIKLSILHHFHFWNLLIL